MSGGLERAITGVEAPRQGPNYTKPFYGAVVVAGVIVACASAYYINKIYQKFRAKSGKPKKRDSVIHIWKNKDEL